MAHKCRLKRNFKFRVSNRLIADKINVTRLSKPVTMFKAPKNILIYFL